MLQHNKRLKNMDSSKKNCKKQRANREKKPLKLQKQHSLMKLNDLKYAFSL